MERLDVTSDHISQLTKALCKVDFFSNLTMGDFERITAFVQLYAYKNGETIFKKGAPGDALFVVLSGALSVSIKKAFFLPALRVSTLKPGDLFGETALIDRSPRTATVRAVEDTQLFVISADDFDRVVASNPVFADVIKRLSSQRKFQTRSIAS